MPRKKSPLGNAAPQITLAPTTYAPFDPSDKGLDPGLGAGAG